VAAVEQAGDLLAMATVTHEDYVADRTLARSMLAALLRTIPVERNACACGRALEGALVTPRALVPPETLRRLELIVGKYMEA